MTKREWKCSVCGGDPPKLLIHPQGLVCPSCYDKLPPPSKEWELEQEIQWAIELAELDDEV